MQMCIFYTVKNISYFVAVLTATSRLLLSQLHAAAPSWEYNPPTAGAALLGGGWTIRQPIANINASADFSFPLQLVYLTIRKERGDFGEQWFCPQLESHLLPAATGVLVWTMPNGGVIGLFARKNKPNTLADQQGTDVSMAENLNISRNEAFEQMNQWDLAQTGPNFTHYIDDGDSLTFREIWSLQELTQSSGFTYIMLMIHGRPDTGMFGINGTRYSSAEIGAAFPTGAQKYWDGCGNYPNGIGESTLNTNFKEKTYNYLFE